MVEPLVAIGLRTVQKCAIVESVYGDNYLTICAPMGGAFILSVADELVPARLE